jgi:hypothetical protein
MQRHQRRDFGGMGVSATTATDTRFAGIYDGSGQSGNGSVCTGMGIGMGTGMGTGMGMGMGMGAKGPVRVATRYEDELTPSASSATATSFTSPVADAAGAVANAYRSGGGVDLGGSGGGSAAAGGGGGGGGYFAALPIMRRALAMKKLVYRDQPLHQSLVHTEKELAQVSEWVGWYV